jgi:sulfoxide reductase heme-binding subunit YedZ
MAAAHEGVTASPLLERVEPVVRRFIRPVLWLVVIVPLVWLVTRLLLSELGANPIEALEHETGEWTLRLLAASLAVTPLITFTRWGWLIPQRRFLGLAAFAYATIHLLVYIGVDQFFNLNDIVEDVLKHLYVTVGMAGFVLLLPLAITSTKGWIRRLGGKRWNQLHRLVYVAAVAGCVHYLWAVKKDITEPLLYAAVFVVLFALRFVRPRPAGKPAASRAAPAA